MLVRQRREGSDSRCGAHQGYTKVVCTLQQSIVLEVYSQRYRAASYQLYRDLRLLPLTLEIYYCRYRRHLQVISCLLYRAFRLLFLFSSCFFQFPRSCAWLIIQKIFHIQLVVYCQGRIFYNIGPQFIATSHKLFSALYFIVSASLSINISGMTVLRAALPMSSYSCIISISIASISFLCYIPALVVYYIALFSSVSTSFNFYVTINSTFSSCTTIRSFLQTSPNSCAAII